jgi:hypothetical protein
MPLKRRRFVQLASGFTAVGTADHWLPSFARSGYTGTLTTGDYRSTRRFVAMECGHIAYIDRGKGRVADKTLHVLPKA